MRRECREECWQEAHAKLYGRAWPMRISTVFQRPLTAKCHSVLTVLLRGPNGRQMSAVVISWLEMDNFSHIPKGYCTGSGPTQLQTWEIQT